ncbi:hypothetical protein BBJ28_00008904 [Nothophytophthora sp. Chile5]|nr:hypothetical protein BBJ28_00008904 [Nothophytophthora sp. Chile5]
MRVWDEVVDASSVCRDDDDWGDERSRSRSRGGHDSSYRGWTAHDEYEDRSRGRHRRETRGNHDGRGRDGHRYGREEHRGDRRGGGRRGGDPFNGPELGAGAVLGSGYERIGDPVADPGAHAEWSGRAGVRDVRSDDPDLQREVLVCRRPNVAGGGRTLSLEVNCVRLELVSPPREIFHYRVDVERTMETPPQEQRPLPRSLVRDVINAALLQYPTEFHGIHVVHDGKSTLYSPVMLPWSAKELSDVDPNGSTVGARDEAPRRGYRGPRTFVVKLKLAKVTTMSTLDDHFLSPDVDAMPVLQALDVAARHLATQRLVPVGHDLFSMTNPHPLNGEKVLCWGYHQAIRLGDRKLLLNVDQAAKAFYARTELLLLVMATQSWRSFSEVRGLSECETKTLAHALHKLEVVPLHRRDRKRPIFGVSSRAADQTVVTIRDEAMSVATYFARRYNLDLRFPRLPLVNVGSKTPGRESWLPIELCEVAPAQRCTRLDDLDTAAVIRQTSRPPAVRRQYILDRVRNAGFENDPFLAAFGLKVAQRLETAEARVLDPPIVQFANVSERPSCGQWNLRDKRFVQGRTLSNWGVVVLARMWSHEVQSFVNMLMNVGGKSGLQFQDQRPHVVYADEHPNDSVRRLMERCVAALQLRQRDALREQRELDGPQLLLVIKRDKDAESYGEIKRVADTELGVPSQCIVAANVKSPKVPTCANVCLKINMKLGGKNSILREPLPLVSSTPTIIFGADVDHPRSGMGLRPSIAAVVASMDSYSAQYASRVAAQKASSDIHHLPRLLCELFLAFFARTKRKPERVVYYRNGVSGDQFVTVLQAEMRALRKAFKMISGDYDPPVTFVMANKRHHLRAFALDGRDADRKGNLLPGTVVDTGIVDPHRFDFYLYGHSGIQGTTVPAHYTVLHDDNHLSAEDIQRLTYHLGYTYARCTRSVSLVTPAYYAHRAAARARCFLTGGVGDSSAVGTSLSSRMEQSDSEFTESTDASFAGTFEFKEVHPNLVDRMFFL